MQDLLSLNERTEVIDYCSKRYGLAATHWEKYELRKSSDAIWAMPVELRLFVEGHSSGAWETAGMRIFSGRKFPYKITSSFSSLFGHFLTKGLLIVSGDQAKQLIFEKQIEIQDEGEIEDGYLVLRYGALFLGVGLKRGFKIESQIPKKLVNQLSSKLELSD